MRDLDGTSLRVAVFMDGFASPVVYRREPYRELASRRGLRGPQLADELPTRREVPSKVPGEVRPRHFGEQHGLPPQSPVPLAFPGRIELFAARDHAGDPCGALSGPEVRFIDRGQPRIRAEPGRVKGH